MTEGLTVADSTSSLQSLSTEEKVNDWLGKCCWTSTLWYTCSSTHSHEARSMNNMLHTTFLVRTIMLE